MRIIGDRNGTYLDHTIGLGDTALEAAEHVVRVVDLFANPERKLLTFARGKLISFSTHQSLGGCAAQPTVETLYHDQRSTANAYLFDSSDLSAEPVELLVIGLFHPLFGLRTHALALFSLATRVVVTEKARTATCAKKITNKLFKKLHSYSPVP